MNRPAGLRQRAHEAIHPIQFINYEIILRANAVVEGKSFMMRPEQDRLNVSSEIFTVPQNTYDWFDKLINANPSPDINRSLAQLYQLNLSPSHLGNLTLEGSTILTDDTIWGNAELAPDAGLLVEAFRVVLWASDSYVEDSLPNGQNKHESIMRLTHVLVGRLGERGCVAELLEVARIVNAYERPDQHGVLTKVAL